MEPGFFILALYLRDHQFIGSERIMISICLLHAKRSIALFSPTTAFWARQMLLTFPLETNNIHAYKKGDNLCLKVYGDL